MEEDKRNVLLFFIISVLIIVGYPYLLGKKDVAQVTPEISVQQISTADQKLHDIMSEHHPLVTQQYKEEWLTIDSNRLSGTISSKGGRINNIILKNYKETLEEGSKNVSIFENPNEFFAETVPS